VVGGGCGGAAVEIGVGAEAEAGAPFVAKGGMYAPPEPLLLVLVAMAPRNMGSSFWDIFVVCYFVCYFFYCVIQFFLFFKLCKKNLRTWSLFFFNK
jgi:hypothetical protein